MVSLVASFAALVTPIPLFNTYRAEDGFTNADIALAVVANSVGTIAALLVLGRLSNHLGRRLTAIASLGLLMFRACASSRDRPTGMRMLRVGADDRADTGSVII
ncbi:hypothetical protein ABZX41_45625, partial [Streptomyces sp. NPDC004533]